MKLQRILLVSGFLTLLGAGLPVYAADAQPEMSRPSPDALPPLSDAPVLCTQEAKQCPDGSYVSRTGPKCEFAPCPDASQR